MSDTKSSYGEPVESPTPVDDVVGRAHEGLADAEAARTRRRRAMRPRRVRPRRAEEPVVVDSPPPVEPMASHEAARLRQRDVRAPPTTPRSEAAVRRAAVAAATPAADTVVTRRAGRHAARAAPPRPPRRSPPQPIFVQAPEAPRPRGNRAAAGAIGLLAALSLRRRSTSPRGSASALLSGDVDRRDVGEVAARRARHLVAVGAGRRLLHRASGCSARSSTAVAGAPGSSSASSSASPRLRRAHPRRSCSRRRSGCSPRARARSSSTRSCSRRSRSPHS